MVNSKRLRSNGDNVKADLQIREARYWAAHAAIGVALQMAIIPLVKAGLIKGGSDDDDTKKEREGKRTYRQQGTIEMFGYAIPLKMFGTIGMLANSIAKDHEDMTPEQRDNRSLLTENLFEFWDTDDLKELQNGIFSNSVGLMGALGEGGTSADRFLLNQINMYTNLIHPAAIAQISRAQLPHYTTQRADGFLEKIKNSFSERSSLYRKATGRYPPTKINAWGEPMMKSGNMVFRMLGITEINKDNFAQNLYEDAEKENSIDYFPPAVTDKIGSQKLTPEQLTDREIYVGQARKTLIGAFSNDQIEFPIVNKLYSDMTPGQKKKALQYFYELGREQGDEKLFIKYESLRSKEKSIDEQVSDDLFNAALEIMKININ